MMQRNKAMKCLLMAIVLLPVFAQAKTPKLNITLHHNSPAEQKRKEQIELCSASVRLERANVFVKASKLLNEFFQRNQFLRRR